MMKKLLLGLLTLTGLLVLSFIFLLYSNTGLQWSIAAAAKFSGNQITINEASGRLAGDIKIKTLQFQSKTMELNFSDIEIKFNPWALLIGHLNIQSLTVKNVNIIQTATADNTVPNPKSQFSFHSPIDITIQGLEVDKLCFTKNTGIKLTLNHLALKGKLSTAFGKNFININLQGTFKNKPLSGEITASIFPGGFEFQNAQLHLAETSINITGGLNDNWDLRWDIKIPNLQTLFNIGSGSLTSVGKIIGGKYTPDIQATASGNSIDLFGISIANLQSNIHMTALKDSYASLKADGISLNGFKINALNLNTLGNLEANTLHLLINTKQGTVNASFKNRWHAQQLQGIITQLTLHSSPLGTWTLQKSTPFTLGKNKITLSPLRLANGNQFIEGAFTVSDLVKTVAPLKGYIRLNYHDLGFLSQIFPAITQASGSILGDLNLAGTLAKPDIKGALKLTGGSITAKNIGLKLKSITLAFDGNTLGSVNLSAHAAAGPGNFQLTGTIGLNQAGLPLKIHLTGHNALIYNSNDYKVYASPDLTFNKTFNKINFSGKIFVPTAIIDPKNFSQGSSALSDDVIFEKNLKKSTKNIFSGNIQINLGKDIKINVKGLTGDLIGSLNINYNSTSDTTATGTLQVINGKFNAYGQSLNVTTGKVIYSGETINNPAIDVVGSKTILAAANASNSVLGQNFSLPTSYSQGTHVTVGVKVQGTLRHHKVSLFSEPAIYSQSDILSLILTGQSASNLSGDNAQLLLKAASSLNLGGESVGNITKELQKTFGLDELGISSESYLDDGVPTQTTSLVLGKHITSRLFVSYAIGLLDPISIFRATYSLTKNWSIQADASSQDTGMDVFYTIEK